MCVCLFKFPTNPFTILELQNLSHDVPEQHKIRQSPDLEALMLQKSSSGYPDVHEKNKIVPIDFNCYYYYYYQANQQTL